LYFRVNEEQRGLSVKDSKAGLLVYERAVIWTKDSLVLRCEISGFHRATAEAAALLVCYAAWISSGLPTFRNTLAVPSLRVKQSSWTAWPAPITSPFVGPNTLFDPFFSDTFEICKLNDSAVNHPKDKAELWVVSGIISHAVFDPGPCLRCPFYKSDPLCFNDVANFVTVVRVKDRRNENCGLFGGLLWLSRLIRNVIITVTRAGAVWTGLHAVWTNFGL